MTKAAITDLENRKAAQLQSHGTTLAQMPDDVLGKIWGYKHAHETIKRKVKEKHAWDRDMRLWNVMLDEVENTTQRYPENRRALAWHNSKDLERPWNKAQDGLPLGWGGLRSFERPRSISWGLTRFLE